MLVAYAPSEFMHEAKDDAHLISRPCGVHLTDVYRGSLTRGTAHAKRSVSLSHCSVKVGDVAPCRIDRLNLKMSEHCSFLYMFL